MCCDAFGHDKSIGKMPWINAKRRDKLVLLATIGDTSPHLVHHHVQSSFHGCADDLHVWRRALGAGGFAAQQGAGRRPTCCQHHGPHSFGQHPAIRRVQFAVESHGGRCHGGSLGGAGADALHSRDCCTLGTGRTYRVDRQHAGAQQHIQMLVHVGWRYRFHDRRYRQDDDSLMLSHRCQ